MFILPIWTSAPWYLLLDEKEMLKGYDPGSQTFTCSSSRIYGTQDLQPAQARCGPNCVFISGTKWPVIVVAKSKLTVAKINQANILHARLGRIAPATMKVVIWSGIHTGIDVTIHDIEVQVPTGSCSICAQARLNNPSFHAQDQTWITDHLSRFMVVCLDITYPLTESACGSRYLDYLTCNSTKWSWVKRITKKHDLGNVFKGFSAWGILHYYEISVVKIDAESVYFHGAFHKHCSDHRVTPYFKDMNGQRKFILVL